MKKVLVVFLAFIIALTLPMTIFATNVAGDTYTINGITIVFADNSSFTDQEQSVIAELIANGEENHLFATYNLMCTLFGHKTTTETIGVIEHCVSATAPRCIETVQDVTMCTRCETVIDIYVISSNYIFCCD